MLMQSTLWKCWFKVCLGNADSNYYLQSLIQITTCKCWFQLHFANADSKYSKFLIQIMSRKCLQSLETWYLNDFFRISLADCLSRTMVQGFKVPSSKTARQQERYVDFFLTSGLDWFQGSSSLKWQLAIGDSNYYLQMEVEVISCKSRFKLLK